MIIYLNADSGGFSFNKKDYLLRAAKRMDWLMFQDVRDAIGPIDYLLNIQPCNLKRGGKWSGLWHIDVSLDSHFPDQYGEMNTIFVASSVGIRPYDKQIVMFQALDPELHRRIPEIKQDFDFTICGHGGSSEGCYGKRGHVYDILQKKYKYNPGGGGLPPEKFVVEYNRAKVQVVQPCMGSNGWGMCAQRFFECLGIGPVLCDWTPDLELLDLKDGEDYMSYKSDSELIEKMDLLLADENLRNKIFENGRRKALASHTFEHRLVTIFNIVKDYADSNFPTQ